MKRREFLKAAGATALVVSMSALTGCGVSGSGGTGGSTGGGSAGGGSGSGEEPGGNIGGSGSEDPGTTKPEKLTYKNSKTAKYFASKGITATNFYMEGTVQSSWSGKILLAASGGNVRYRKYFKKENATTGWNILMEKDTAYQLNDTQKQYQLYAYAAPSNWTEKQIRSSVLRMKYGEGYFCVPTGEDVLQIQEKKVVVNGATYDAEELFIATEKNGSGYNGYALNFCFEGEVLRYITSGNASTGTIVTTINTLYPNPSSSLVKLPRNEYTELGKDERIDSDWEF